MLLLAAGFRSFPTFHAVLVAYLLGVAVVIGVQLSGGIDLVHAQAEFLVVDVVFLGRLGRALLVPGAAALAGYDGNDNQVNVGSLFIDMEAGADHVLLAPGFLRPFDGIVGPLQEFLPAHGRHPVVASGEDHLQAGCLSLAGLDNGFADTFVYGLLESQFASIAVIKGNGPRNKFDISVGFCRVSIVRNPYGDLAGFAFGDELLAGDMPVESGCDGDSFFYVNDLDACGHFLSVLYFVGFRLSGSTKNSGLGPGGFRRSRGSPEGLPFGRRGRKRFGRRSRGTRIFPESPRGPGNTPGEVGSCRAAPILERSFKIALLS